MNLKHLCFCSSSFSAVTSMTKDAGIEHTDEAERIAKDDQLNRHNNSGKC